ncbi:DNA translocase FtsK [uncultured Acidaminococcus sp.]|uniref:FtsK/SpoIIIE family DNA translocase n=1 Tax=uncultured Acidaminococcus sp. TaxID=352152 RepID=UPI00260332E0|nr:DNA translocase FtsK [uncultured Acidaminococcus sp.]
MEKKERTRRNNKKIEFTFNREVLGILLAAFAVFMLCALAGLATGSAGDFLKKVLTYALGVGAFLFPLYVLVLGIGYVVNHEHLRFSKKFFTLLLFLVSVLSLWHMYKVPEGHELLPEYLMTGGGLLGGAIVFVLTKAVGRIGSVIVLVASALASMVLSGKFSLRSPLLTAQDGVKEGADAVAQKWEDYQERRKKHHDSFYDQEKDDGNYNRKPEPEKKPTLAERLKEKVTAAGAAPLLKFQKEQVGTGEPPRKFTITTAEDARTQEESQWEAPAPEAQTARLENAETGEVIPYEFPPLDLLNRDKPVNKKNFQAEIEAQGGTIEQTLHDFGVNATLVNVTKGPSVTRYELEPAPGVKVNKIQNLSEDIALKLAVSSVRIEPIPGKAAIGIEVPAKTSEPVSFRSIVDCPEVKNAKGKLCIGLGKDISGRVVVADLSKMPHLLIAGSTGSGKSVCINTIICSLLYKAAPDEVKLILVDPKVVELTNYNGIPHLLTPVVTGPKQAASALHWAVVEMERRYSLFAKTQVRKIDDYNALVQPGEKLPFIVVIIDELSDLMMVAAVDVEDAILRLAQKARAAGIHLILATQRPSVDVLTGTIKANIPSRIAFAVSSQIDSRTILDASGAEKLLGRGDMLFFPTGANKPIRVQGAYIADDELNRVVDFIKAEAIPTSYSQEVTTQQLNGAEGEKKDEGSEEDELFQDAVELVMATQQASSSMLQRKFRIGYTRAARLVDAMEEKGIVGPADGSKPRPLLMSPTTIKEKFFTKGLKQEGE